MTVNLGLDKYILQHISMTSEYSASVTNSVTVASATLRAKGIGVSTLLLGIELLTLV